MNYEERANNANENKKRISNDVRPHYFLRKRKMMLVLPVLVLPFLTLAFWAMGGGKASANEKGTLNNATGLNLHLPDPKLKKEALLDKLGFYDKAYRDSVKLKEQIRSDPYFQEQNRNEDPTKIPWEAEDMVQQSAEEFHPSFDKDNINPSPFHTGSNTAEEKLVQKLSELNSLIHQPQAQTSNTNSSNDIHNSLSSNPKFNSNVERLENMMQTMNQADQSDPELDKLSKMMDKIIDIQHPGRLEENAKENAFVQHRDIFSVSAKADSDTSVNGFYSLENERDSKMSNAFEAVVNEDQTLVNGACIKLRLLDAIFIKGSKIPAGNFVYGQVSLNGERLQVEISSIRSGHSIYPVKMEVYDLDGLRGIYVRGTITGDAARQSVDNNLQSMQLATLDPSLAAQATAAGISTVKNLLSKKVKLVKVFVKAGYRVLLKNQTAP